MVYMETERLILRDYCATDFEGYYRLKTDPKTMYYLQDIQLSDREAGYAEFQMVLEDMRQPDRRLYFIHAEGKDTREQVGSVGYTVTDFTPVGKLVHAGYFIYPRFWGMGYTTEALKRIVEFAFSENDVYRISTGCLAENAASERVMEKCGFTKEAERVDCQWHDGKMKTRVEYRLLRREWG